MKERWKDIPGFEGRYQVSDLGRIKSLSFMQRYLLRNGKENYRRTKEKIRALNNINSGYFIVQLWLDDVGYSYLVHRLVAEAFVPGSARTVNHKDGNKKNNKAANLEWMSYSENHLHAVGLGIWPSAIGIIGQPLKRGKTLNFGSVSQALAHFNAPNGGGNFISECLAGRRESAYGYVWARA